MKSPVVYIISNKKRGTIYTGVTSNIIKRIYEHKTELLGGFSKKYACKMLVFFEGHSTIYQAISREKQIKSWSRKKKIKLVEETNPKWQDLYPDIIL